jgi:hypothetical protein
VLTNVFCIFAVEHHALIREGKGKDVTTISQGRHRRIVFQEMEGKAREVGEEGEGGG